MPKNIVICCDGTSNQFGQANSNVVKLYSVLDKESAGQVAYYDPGVGTMSDPGLNVPLGKKVSVLLGLLFGYGLEKNVAEAYGYLMEQWEPGDKIFLFGFSRGAYTVRVLAGFMHLMGLLSKGCQHLIPYAWRLFALKTREADDERSRKFEIAAKFRKNYGRQVPIEFVGVWDTVSSIGWVTKRKTFPHTKDNPSVRHVRHAIALDERRAFYDPNFWYGKGKGNTDVKEVWFAGVHSDVGGSYSEQESGLAKIALQWMVQEAHACGLAIDKARYNRVVLGQAAKGGYIGPDHKATAHRSLSGLWWLLEILPKNKPLEPWRFTLPLGRCRRVREGARIHQSVLDRIKDLPYLPPNLPETREVEPFNPTLQ